MNLQQIADELSALYPSTFTVLKDKPPTLAAIIKHEDSAEVRWQMRQLTGWKDVLAVRTGNIAGESDMYLFSPIALYS